MTGVLVGEARPGRLTRSSREKLIAGVCGGLGEHFQLDPALVRIGYILVSALTIFPGIVAYIVLMFLLPPPEEVPV